MPNVPQNEEMHAAGVETRSIPVGPTGTPAIIIEENPSCFTVKHVYNNSPASGKVKVGDLICGANVTKLKTPPHFAKKIQGGKGMKGPLTEMAPLIEASRGSDGKLDIKKAVGSTLERDAVFALISESHTGRTIRTKKWKYAVAMPGVIDHWVEQEHTGEIVYQESFLYDLEMDPHARSSGMAIVDSIELEDFHLFADPIVEVIINKNQKYTQYHCDNAAKTGLAIFNRLNIVDGITLAIVTIHPGIRGLHSRITGERGRLALLNKYGANVKPYVPRFREVYG